MQDFTRYGKYQDLGRWYVTNFVKGVSESLPRGAVVLDAGAGECAYKPFFTHCRYLAVDMGIGDQKWEYARLDLVGDLETLPIQSGSCDAVVSTQTLEHLQNPHRVVQEFFRVLKPKGTLYLSAPFAQVMHQMPHDYFRYTYFGLNSLLTRAGFREQDIRIKPFGGFLVRWAYESSMVLDLFPPLRHPDGGFNTRSIPWLPVKVFFRLAVAVSKRILVFLDRFVPDKRLFTHGWQASAVKDDRD